MPAVLLPHDEHERGAVDARGRDGPDRIPEPGRRVQDRERRGRAGDRVARRQAHDRPLVEREHEAQVVREVGQEGDLRGAGVREQRRQAAAAEDVEGGVPDGAGQRRAGLSPRPRPRPRRPGAASPTAARP